MKSFVVMTYYQLMHSIAMALTLEEKPMLYFSKSYLNVQEDLLERIRQCGVFSGVVGITGRGELTKFIAEINKTKDCTDEEIDEIGNSIFEKHLEPYYAELFKDADFNDTIYVYNDFQWHFYYIDKHFEDIVGIEDGYASLKQQINIHRFKGDQQLVIPFLGKYYPEPLYRSPKIHKIISSKFFDEIPDDYKEKLQIMDFNDLIQLHFEEYKEALLYIFNIADYDIKDGGVLFLSQPLARAQYCEPIQEYLMKRKILNNEVAKGKDIYFKAHPADTIDPMAFKDDNIHILPGSFPVELLNYKGCTFEKVLSFGSTGVNTMDCAKSFEVLFPNQNAEKDEINSFIKGLVDGETTILKVAVLVNSLTPDAYVNVYSGFYPLGEYLTPRVTVVVPTELKDEATAYFDRKKLSSRISKYEKKHSQNGICVWSSDLRKIEKNADRFGSPKVVACDDLDNEAAVVEALKADDQAFDLIMIVNERDLLFSPLKSIKKEYNKRFAACIVFQNYTQIPEKKMKFPYVTTAPGYVNDQILGTLQNKVWQRALYKDLIVKSDGDRVRTINKDYKSFSRKFSDDLYVPYEHFVKIPDGYEYYLAKANEIVSAEADDPDVMVLLLSEVVLTYLDWLKVTNNDTVVFGELIDQLDISETIKKQVFEAVCHTLYYEKNGRYRIGSNENNMIGQYLLKEVGVSEKLIKGTRALKKVKKRLGRK